MALLHLGFDYEYEYGVATIGRMLRNIGLVCKKAIQKRLICCKREMYIF